MIGGGHRVVKGWGGARRRRVADTTDTGHAEATSSTTPRARQSLTSGVFFTWLVTQCLGPLSVLSLAEARWELVIADDDDDVGGGRRRRRQGRAGDVRYILQRTWNLPLPVPFDGRLDRDRPIGTCQDILRCLLASARTYDAMQAPEFPDVVAVDAWLELAEDVCVKVLSNTLNVLLLLVPVPWGQPRYAHLPLNHPAKRHLIQWWRHRLEEDNAMHPADQPPDQCTSLPSWCDRLIRRSDKHKPARLQQHFGALKIIRGIRLAQHLRDTRLLQKNSER